MITQAYLREKFDYNPETGILVRRSSGRRAGSPGPGSYRSVMIRGKEHMEHRLIWMYVEGAWPSGQIDHQNHVRDDNRWANLKSATPSQNNKNHTLHRNNTSGAVGVSWFASSRKWRAYIWANGRFISLGLFRTKDAAYWARKEAELIYGFHENHGQAK